MEIFRPPQLDGPEHEQLRVKLLNRAIRSPYEHQLDGAAWLVQMLTANGRCMLLDEMGTGKTKTAIDAARYLMDEGLISNVFVLCPKTLTHNWRNEILLSAGPSADVTIVEGNRARRIRLLSSRTTWFVANYELARTLPTEMYGRMGTKTLLICDEAHRLKNPTTQTTKTVRSVMRRHVLLMTGTPIANAPEDVFSSIDIVTYGKAYSSWLQFKRYHLGPYGYQHLDLVNSYLEIYGLRRLLDEVVSLPEMVHAPRFTPLTDAQRPRYNSMRDEFAAWVTAQDGDTFHLQAVNALAHLTRLYQITSGFLPLPGEDGRTVEYFDSAKLAALDDLLDELGGRKLAVFCRFRATMERLRTHFSHLQPALIHGDVRDRQAQVDRFSNEKECRLFIGQLQSAHEGINLERECAHVVFFERMFSPLYNDQAAMRIRRIGQKTRQVLIPLVAQDTIDERLTELLTLKADWRESVLHDKRRLLDFIG